MVQGYLVPHPPLIVKGVGDGTEIPGTRAAYEEVAAAWRAFSPDVTVIISPHSILYADYFHISPGKSARGDFRQYRASHVRFEVAYDQELARRIAREAEKEGIPAGFEGERDKSLDHGVMVPLYFLKAENIVRVSLSGLPFLDQYRFGMCIRRAIDALGRRAAVVASGDMSHKLGGSYGFSQKGVDHDAYVKECLERSDVRRLIQIDPALAEGAAQCGLASIMILCGALDGDTVRSRVLHYEGPYGVGYLTAILEAAGPETDGAGVAQTTGTEGPDEMPGVSSVGRQGEGERSRDGGQRRGGRSLLPILMADKEARIARIREGEDPYVRLARANVEQYVRTGKPLHLGSDGKAVVSNVPATADRAWDDADMKTDIKDDGAGYTVVRAWDDADGTDHSGGATDRGGERAGGGPQDASAPTDAGIDLPPEMLGRRAGVFVSIHKNGNLRGCIGTTAPTTSSVAEEIIQNGVSAAARDPRFSPITADELDDLTYSVDILFPPEPIKSKKELDPGKYGVIVSNGRRRGLLLPHLDGVDTVDEQVSIALRKGGIRESEDYAMERFEVIRHG
ncbi:MAG: AmmeMemoRadiSam system protein A [Lachnospiraceae bacterium]|jgi:AmmeMemoRadiSam system protein A|nr:AmmeMemoRadiSam system protein A [Lachnospiraceae bacterium]